MDDKKQFAQLLTTALQMYGKTNVLPAEMQLWWNALEGYPFELVSKAFGIHAQTSERTPVPASIIKHLPDNSGYPSPEEAWNACPKSEKEGGYMCQPMRDALNSCLDSIDRGDLVSARMAFLEKYKSAVADAKFSGLRPVWRYSGPTICTQADKELIHEYAIQDARKRGWIGLEQTQQDMNSLNSARMLTADVQVEVSSGAEKYLTQPENKEQAQKIKKMLACSQIGNGSQKTGSESNQSLEGLNLITQDIEHNGKPSNESNQR